jgi:hypothetical protein
LSDITHFVDINGQSREPARFEVWLYRRRVAQSPGEVLQQISPRQLTPSGAVGLATHPTIGLPIVSIGIVVSVLVEWVPPLAAILAVFAIGTAAAAVIVRHRVGLVVSGELVAVRNLWRSAEVAIEDVASIRAHVFWWSRGMWCAEMVLVDGRHVPIHATSTFRLRDLTALRSEEIG